MPDRDYTDVASSQAIGKEKELGSRVWSRFSLQDQRKLRLAGRQALIRAGVPLEMVTAREVDRWLESRLEDTLELMLKSMKDRGIQC